jgi:hypothetical protein
LRGATKRSSNSTMVRALDGDALRRRELGGRRRRLGLHRAQEVPVVDAVAPHEDAAAAAARSIGADTTAAARMARRCPARREI